jgi:hypothetical protein
MSQADPDVENTDDEHHHPVFSIAFSPSPNCGA